MSDPRANPSSLVLRATREPAPTAAQREMLELAVRSIHGNPWPLIGIQGRTGGAKSRMFEGMRKLGWFDRGNCITPAGRAALGPQSASQAPREDL